MMCSAAIEISLTPSGLLFNSRICQINYRESLVWVGPLGTQRNKTGILHPRNIQVPEPQPWKSQSHHIQKSLQSLLVANSLRLPPSGLSTISIL